MKLELDLHHYNKMNSVTLIFPYNLFMGQFEYSQSIEFMDMYWIVVGIDIRDTEIEITLIRTIK